jgi:hypothetical protein
VEPLGWREDGEAADVAAPETATPAEPRRLMQ